MSKPYYSVEAIEKTGLQASGTFFGVPRHGWLMPTGHFVDYAGYAQVAIPVAEASGLKIDVFHEESANTFDLELKGLADLVERSGSDVAAAALGWDSKREMAQERVTSCLQRGWMELQRMYQSTTQARLRREKAGIPEGTFIELPEADEIDFS